MQVLYFRQSPDATTGSILAVSDPPSFCLQLILLVRMLLVDLKGLMNRVSIDGGYGYCYNVYCQSQKINETPYSSPSAASLQECVNLCDDATSQCNSFDFNSFNGICNLYASTSVERVDQPGFAVGGYDGGAYGQTVNTCH